MLIRCEYGLINDNIVAKQVFSMNLYAIGYFEIVIAYSFFFQPDMTAKFIVDDDGQ